MEGVDRLNELKDEMLVNNISFIDNALNQCTTKELIKTTATMSKRWRNLWTQLPHLSFIDDRDITYYVVEETHLHGYISFIDNTLNQCPTNLNLKKFKLDIIHSSLINSKFESRANSWIRYAISRNVEDDDLQLCVGEPFSYDDELFFNNLCFNHVKLSWCVLNPPNGEISWERLKCLCLSYVTLDEAIIENILSESPCLESLELNDCYGYRRIDITSKSVKKLVFSGYNSHHGINAYNEAYIDYVKIDAPYISSLTIKAELVLREFVLLNVSSLVETHLDYWMDSWIFPNEDVLRGILEILSHVEDVTFGDHAVEQEATIEGEDEDSIIKSNNSLYKFVDAMGGYMNVTFNDKWYQVAKIMGLAYEHHETVKEVYKEYIGMVKVYYEEAKRSRHGEPRDVAVNYRGTAGRERPQVSAKINAKVEEMPDETPRKRSGTEREDVNMEDVNNGGNYEETNHEKETSTSSSDDFIIIT
nr:hypothetical protein [Tanacetum cinerariifolium]